MWLDLVSNSGPLVLESDSLPTAPSGPAVFLCKNGRKHYTCNNVYLYNSILIYLKPVPCVSDHRTGRSRQRGHAKY